MSEFVIKAAEPEDVPLILRFIEDLAEYERLSHEVVATEERLHETLFGDHAFVEVVIGWEGEVAVGFALFFPNYSTFVGLPGIHLEDLFVVPEKRGKGYGKALLVHLAGLVVARGWGRLEWVVLDWNEPSINFYHSLGGVPLNDWTTFRLHGKALYELAEG